MANALENIDNIAQASFEELVAIDEIGEKIALSIQHYFSDERTQTLINRLKHFGLQFEVQKKALNSTKLEGKTFVVSGVFTHFSRDEIKLKIEENGGKNAGSISTKTTYVLAGENMGPAKLEKASALGIQIISENDFIEMIS